MKRISIFLALAASALHAAIITEQNDLYLYLPDYATFRGTSAAPGIDSCWIPYGTYTGGEGGTEYLRVTSNLVGVVFSAYDGLFERDYGRQKSPDNLYWGSLYPSNDTLRVFDWLNHGYYGENMTIEHVMAYVEAEEDKWWIPGSPTNLYHRGVMARFGSRALDALAGEAAIPIPTSWSETLPFRAADSNAWANVFPMFDALQFDAHIWPAQTNATVRPAYVRDWLGHPQYGPGAWVGTRRICGQDHIDAAESLLDVMSRIPLPYTILDVLSVDTGWDADDYAHWNNGTTRLDWKRLGIICQLERQSEITMDAGDEGRLPFVSSKARRTETFESEYTVPAFTIPLASPDTEIDRIDTSKLTWNSATNRFTNAVALVGTSFPTARAVPPVLQGSIYSIPMTNGMALCVPDIDLEMHIKNVIEDLAPPQIGGLGSFRITTDYVVVEWNGPRLLVQLNGIYDADDHSFLGYDDTGMTASIEGMQVAATPIALEKDIAKSSDFAYTRCLAKERAGVISNAVERGVFAPYYYYDDIWASNKVASAEMPTWEVMLDAVGSNVLDLASLSIDDGMEWDDLVHRRSTSDCTCMRRYRLSPVAISGTSFAGLSSMWLTEILGLDAAVKERMQDVGGVNVVVADSQRAVISDDDKRRLDRDLGKSLAVMYGVAGMMPSEGVAAWLEATIGYHEGEVVSVDIDGFWWQEWDPPFEVHDFPHTEDGWQLGSLVLYTESTSASVDLGSEVPPARVDAHQSSMSRILWRFKNLRDPNL